MRRALRLEHVDHSLEELWALKDVSFTVEEGEVVGFIGRNGAGKSTLLKILTRITPPDRGHARRSAAASEASSRSAPASIPELTGRENTYLNGAILGMKRREISAKFDEIVEFSGIGKFIDTPVKRYSSGMYVRLAFAVAAHLDPEVLIIDEVLAVGDYEFQQRCMGRIEDISGSGRTVLFVSHDMQAITRLCGRAYWLQSGRVMRPRGRARRSSRGTSRRPRAPGPRRLRASTRRRGPRRVRLLSRPRRRLERRDGRTRRRRARADRDRAQLRRARRRPARSSRRSSSATTAARSSSTRSTPTRAGATDAGAGHLHLHRLDPAEPPERGRDRRRRHRRLARRRRSSSTTSTSRRSSGSTSRDPGLGDSAKGLFTGQLRGGVRPLLDWTTEYVEARAYETA